MGSKALDRGMLALLVVSVVLNLGLASKVHRLTKTAEPTTLAIGTHVSEIRAEDLAGRPVQVQFASTGKPTVLYVFSPTCHWCAKNLGNIKKLYEQEHTSYTFLGVSLGPDDVPHYIAESGFPLSAVRNPSQDTVKTLHLAGTPETIVIDPSGVVQQVWAGAYRRDLCREIESYFHLSPNTLNRT